ncbi:nucleotidyltransferase [Alkalibaculum sp. M08DMB]|uniref:tRNA(Met) cytidine acetate ligase n=1 Tax=Alkalibaculum sporogenes TaxID=2655001 RepID=A0A6A7KA40_9FIRM|nr:nucleotidyltransferase [Alkalibaculum sporogenes]MPW26047.1 nucleotidyltransferase [Alkalibaculum sporogenes]
MKLLSIIAEYNPFHNGHAYHLNISKEKSQCSHTMAIMSGSFLQRGEPALLDKWTRASISVKNGIDLVVELPYVFSCQSAEIFAYGSVITLDALNIVSTLSFGCENDSLSELSEIAKILIDEPPYYRELLKSYLNKGKSFPSARQLALGDFLNTTDHIITTPNNILAIEYLKWLYKFNSSIAPLPIQRVNVGYHDEKIVNNFVGATHIRNLLLKTMDIESVIDVVPDSTYKSLYLYGNQFNNLENYFSLIVGDLFKSSPDELKEFFDVSEGLENRILKSAYACKTMDELVNHIHTKRYTKTRIKRILINFLHSHKSADAKQIFKNYDYKPYLRVLAFNERGKEILKQIKLNSEIKIVTNLAKDYKDLDSFQRYSINKDVLSTNYYYLTTDINKINSDFIKKPEIIQI